MQGTPVHPRKLPQQARSRATVDRIVTAAAHIFAEEGYGATTDRIAQAAQVSVGSLYQYFPNKDALVLELATRHLSASTEALAPALTGTGPADHWIPTVVAVMVDEHRDAPLHRVLYDQAPRTPTLVAAFAATEEHAVREVARLIRTEYAAAPGVAEQTAHVLVTMIETLVHRLVDVLPARSLRTEVSRAARAYLRDAMARGGA